jgi:hypothetical protein
LYAPPARDSDIARSASFATLTSRTVRARYCSPATNRRPASGSPEGTSINNDTTADFDLHGIVGVRVLDARPADVAVVARQLGPLPRRLERDPDIVIRFVDRIDPGSRLRYLGAREIGWTDDALYVLKSRKEPAMVRIPMDRIGGPCEIVCERGLRAVPFLIAILNLTALVNGALPLHAGAFELDGRGVLVTGWSKGGKTELLMAAAGAGARYVGDEWVYLTSDGLMHGIPEPVRLWDWHLAQLPDVRRTLGPGDRLKLAAIPAFGRVERAMPGVVRRSAPGRLFHKAMPVLEGQLHVDLPPERLFGELGSLSARLDHVLFVVGAAGSDTTVEPIAAAEVAQRMAFSLLYERLDLAALYQQARFAFPDLANVHLDAVDALQRGRLMAMLADRPAHIATHPYPVDLKALLDAVRPVLG